jgi:hypothetical protein
MFHRIFTIGLLVGAVACGSPQTPAATAPSTTAAPTPVNGADAPPTPDGTKTKTAECQLYCEAPQMLPRAALEPDYTKEETDNANRVLDTMKDDLIACYKKRLRVNPDAHGFITVDILVGPDGNVMKTETTGGALLGKDTMQCIVKRMEKATFQKPHGGGTLHIRMPFSLRKIGPDDDDSI